MLNELIHVIPCSKDALYWSLDAKLWLVRGLPRHPLPSIPPFWPCRAVAGAHLCQGSVGTGFPGILGGKQTWAWVGAGCVRGCLGGWVWGSRVLRGGGHISNLSSKFRKSLATSRSGISEMLVRVKPALPPGATLGSWFSHVPWWDGGFWGYCDLLLELLRFLPQLFHLPHGGQLEGWLLSLLPGTRGVCRGTRTRPHLCSLCPHQTPHGGLEPPPHIGPGLGGLHRLPCQPLHIWSPGPPPHPPQPPAPEGRARPAPLTWALTLSFQLWSPGASGSLSCDTRPSPAQALLPEELAWPGPAWRGGRCGGVQTGKGRANDDCQANEISWRVAAGGGGGGQRMGREVCGL